MSFWIFSVLVLLLSLWPCIEKENLRKGYVYSRGFIHSGLLSRAEIKKTISFVFGSNENKKICFQKWLTFKIGVVSNLNCSLFKTKNVYKKFIISKFQNYFQTRFYLHISICQSQFIMSRSKWDTLYIWC